jgi:asparagine synthase (glutamine-hydrolysing)
MRRLSIIDITGGHQPMFNEDGTVVAVFNGEIYNFPELQKKLVSAGHRFRSDHSDTETIVHLYEEYGDDFLDHLNGMFAIALWDAGRQRLILARDRVGIKPLYFARTPNGIVFGSEIKALLEHPDVSRRPNFEALYHYLSFKNTPSPSSAFADIEQLRPGELAIINNNQLSLKTWWMVRFCENSQTSEEEAAFTIRSLLEDSVKLQMRSDVPFGAYLSGGVDSSSVVALMSRMSGGHAVKTFSLVYDDDVKHKAEDQKFARMVSSIYGTQHHEHLLSATEAVESVEGVLEAFDEPFSGVTSTYFLTRLISRHVKVALSGDGADELFGSYLSHRLAQPLAHLRALQAAGRPLTDIDCESVRPFQDRLPYLKDILSRGDEADQRLALYLWDDQGKQELTTPLFRELAHHAFTRDQVASTFNQVATDDPLNRALAYDFATLLPDQVLPFVDRLSMAHSVEVRPPFLDHRLVEYAATIPGHMKIRSGREKHILKEAMRGLIPDEILSRRKEGFVLPVDQWLLSELRPIVEDRLSESNLASHGMLQPSAVRHILDLHFSGQANNGPRIWNIFMFQVWWDRYQSRH